jgi:hypothetical protein
MWGRAVVYKRDIRLSLIFEFSINFQKWKKIITINLLNEKLTIKFYCKVSALRVNQLLLVGVKKSVGSSIKSAADLTYPVTVE